MSIQFSRIEKPSKPAKRQDFYMENQKICRCCQVRPVAGYVIGSGHFLTNVCLKCFRAAGIESRERARHPKFSNQEGRS